MMVAGMSLSDQALKDAFVKGRLAIDCLEIKLTRNGAGEPSVLSCPGSMSVTPSNGIEARLVLARGAHQPYDFLANINKHADLRSGQLLSPSRYFKLEAKDVTGHLWTNPSANVDIEHLPEAFIVKITCGWVRCKTLVEGNTSSTHMVFMEELIFPDNVIHSKKVLERGKTALKFSAKASAGEAAGMLITFDPRADSPGVQFGEFYAMNQSASSLPDYFDDRLVEAIRFCTAAVVEPVMRETVHKGKKTFEFAQHRPPNEGMLQPPLQPRGNDLDFYKLLGCYFQYACANASGRDYAPLSAKVGSLFALKGVNLEIVALLVAVAVESVLGEQPFKEIGKPTESTLSLFKQMIAHINTASGFGADFLKRITDVVGGMKSSRAKDKLHALVSASVIDEEDCAAWSKTRNKTAHGSFEIDPAELQELLDVVYRLSALVYKLVFLRIGYRGKFTDYSTHDWPLRDFTRDLGALSHTPAPAPSSGVASAPTPPTPMDQTNPGSCL